MGDPIERPEALHAQPWARGVVAPDPSQIHPLQSAVNELVAHRASAFLSA